MNRAEANVKRKRTFALKQNSKQNKPIYNLECKFCKSKFETKNPNRKFCSNVCIGRSVACSLDYSKLGKLSAIVQKKSRRSKNESLFYDLCQKKFPDALANEALFDGWDADMVIPSIKYAVLWNGKWHYEKITEKHSVEQVQNRDRLKLKKIIEAGYKTFIVKDMGRFNKSFVLEQFSIFENIVDGRLSVSEVS